MGPQGKPEFRVEVKGTQGVLGPVTVTAGEVGAARRDGIRTVLAVVHDIQVTVAADGSSTVSGGTLWRDNDWRPEDADLKAISYQYTNVG